MSRAKKMTNKVPNPMYAIRSRENLGCLSNSGSASGDFDFGSKIGVIIRS